jgi:hypothetical protein
MSMVGTTIRCMLFPKGSAVHLVAGPRCENRQLYDALTSDRAGCDGPKRRVIYVLRYRLIHLLRARPLCPERIAALGTKADVAPINEGSLMAHSGDLVGERDGRNLRGRRANNAVSQGRCLVPWIWHSDPASAPVVNRLRK